MDGHTAKDIGMKKSASELALQELLTKLLSRQESILDTSPLDPSFDLMNWVSLQFLCLVVSLVQEPYIVLKVLVKIFWLQDYTCELRDSLLKSEILTPAGLFIDAQSSICGTF